MYYLFHYEEKGDILKTFGKDSADFGWTTEITFMFGLDSVVRPAPPKRQMTASCTNTVLLTVCYRLALSKLANDEKRLARVLERGLSSDTGLSTRP